MRRATKRWLEPRWVGWLAAALLLGMVPALNGCGSGPGSSLTAFESAWHGAVNANQPQRLYDLLDAGSQRWIEARLETLRGLPVERQREFLAWLGGDRVDDLTALTPAMLFGRLWEHVTLGARPTMRMAEVGGDWAIMEVRLGPQKAQRFRVVLEDGRWRWVVPEDATKLPQ